MFLCVEQLAAYLAALRCIREGSQQAAFRPLLPPSIHATAP